MKSFLSFREQVEQVLAEGKMTKRRARSMSRVIRDRIADCERFYPWPALVESLQRDIERLKVYL
jgi:hypothetical protein